MASADRALLGLTPTAPVAAGTLIAGYAVASASGSRPLGGVVLLVAAAMALAAWLRADTRTAALI